MTVTLDTEERLVAERIDQLLRDHDPKTTDAQTFWGAQFDAGLGWVHFPEGRGGLGLSPKHQVTIQQRLSAAGAHDNWARNVIGLGISAPVIVAHGTEEQMDRYLRPMFTCEEIWCQLMSEPGAGSDMAGLSTSAVRSGDEWIVNGQKVWTTLAHMARRGTLIVRTDPDAPKHKGMTHFVVDMDQPGVEVRPLRQITGDAEFNEVFFTDARIPDSERLGEEGEGWRVALTMLMNERVAIGARRIPPRGSGPISEAMRLLKERGGSDPVARDRVMREWILAEVDPAHEHPGRTDAQARDARPGRLGRKAAQRRAEPADLLALSEPHGPRRRDQRAGFGDAASGSFRDGINDPAGGAALDGEHDRGRDVRDHAQHPRRARPRAPGRPAHGQGRAVERGPAQLTTG